MPAHNRLPVYRCRRVFTTWEVDGDLTKPVWQSSPAIELALAENGEPPQQPTTARGLWDGEHLYLAFECADKDIRATLSRRDDKVWQEEAVEAFIAPYGDLRHYYEFQCSPANVVRDLRVTNPNARAENLVFDGSWDCAGWQTAVTHRCDPQGNELGWAAEWRVPLAALLEGQAGPVRSGEEWRANLYRIDRWPREEFSAWSSTPGSPLSFHRPGCFGRWIFE